MCAISCRIVLARLSYAARVCRLRKMYSSRNVTQPAFSIAPMLYSGTNSWSYLPNGYGHVEGVLEELEALLGHLEDVVGVQVLPAATPAGRCRAGSSPRLPW